MTLPTIIARNSTNQIIGETKIGRVTSQSTGLYTVPAGKTAKILAVTGVVDGTGSDATAGIAIKRGAEVRPIGPYVAVNGLSSFVGEMVLVAGDIVTTQGDNGGTNAGIDMTVTFIEL